MSKTLLFALLAAPLTALMPPPALAATPAAVQAAQSPTMPGPGNFMGRGKGPRLAGFLSPEQRAMFMLQARDQRKTLAPDARKAWRKDQVQKFLAMPQADRDKFKADLQAKWDGLPQDQKDRLQQRLAARQTRQGAQ